jgi:hypothetical protein
MTWLGGVTVGAGVIVAVAAGVEVGVAGALVDASAVGAGAAPACDTSVIPPHEAAASAAATSTPQNGHACSSTKT